MSHRYQEANYEDDVEVEDIPPFAPPELWQGIDNAFNHRRNRLIPSVVDKPNRAGIWIERFMSRDWVQWEWKVLVVGQRMRGLLAQAITDRWPRFFRYSNANDYIVDFPVTAALRLAAGQTTNRDVIDFCLSSQGLLLQPIPELLADSSGLTYITSKILTTKQGKDWFSGTAGQRRGVVKTVRPWEYDYVFVPLVHPADSWQHPVRGLVEGMPLCYFVIIAGLSGRVAKRVFWADPQSDQYSHGLATADPRRQSIQGHLPVLEIDKVVHRIVRAVQVDFPHAHRALQGHAHFFATVYLPIESSKCSDGSGIALCMALARIYQRPHEFLRQHVYLLDPLELRSNPVNPNAPEFLLFPASLDGENIAQGILITLIQTIRAVDQVPPPPPGEGPRTMSDFGIPPTAKEEYLHDKLFPKNLKWWWNLWMNAEYHSWKDALYYMIYKERLDVGEQAHVAHQFREMVDRTRGMRLAGWMASS